MDVDLPERNALQNDLEAVVDNHLASPDQQMGGNWPAGEQPMWMIRNYLDIPGSCRKAAGDYSSNRNYYCTNPGQEPANYERIPANRQAIVLEDRQWKDFKGIFFEVLGYFTPIDHYSKIKNMKENDLDDFFRILRLSPPAGYDEQKWAYLTRRLNNFFHKAHGEVISMFYSVLKDCLSQRRRIVELGVNNNGLTQRRNIACYVLDVDREGIDPNLA
ncbi:hypothetical protein BJ508DRAFT_316454, partial [Ascobolus immersus RN42]